MFIFFFLVQICVAPELIENICGSEDGKLANG